MTVAAAGHWLRGAAASKKNAGTGLQDIAVTPLRQRQRGALRRHIPGAVRRPRFCWADPRSFERADPGSGPEVFDITFSLGLETLLDATGEDGYAKASLHHDAWVDIAGYGDSHLFDLDASVDSNGAFSCTFTYQSGLTWLNGTDPTQVASQLAAYYDAATSTWSLPQDYTISLEVPISVDVDIFDFGWDTQVNSQASATPELSTWGPPGLQRALGGGDAAAEAGGVDAVLPHDVPRAARNVGGSRFCRGTRGRQARWVPG